MAHKKPPLSGAPGGSTGLHSKKQRKPYIKNTNTISHEDENKNPNMLMFGMQNEPQLVRKTGSQKRPQTAKTKKPLSVLGGG